jgi:hypothetical protein
VQTPIHNKQLIPKRFEEDKLNRTDGFFKAVPRPVTSHARANNQMSS